MDEFYPSFPIRDFGGAPDADLPSETYLQLNAPSRNTEDAHLTTPQTLPQHQLDHSPISFSESITFQPPNSEIPKARKRSGTGAEHVKHRRTRDGCYTCRKRRVKCDEAYPICERCRKGARDCVFPDSVRNKNAANSEKSKEADSVSQSSPAASPGVASQHLETPKKYKKPPDMPTSEDNTPESPESLASAEHHSSSSNLDHSVEGSRRKSVDSKWTATDRMSPSTSTSNPGSPAYSNDALDPQSWQSPTEWSHLPPDLEFYLHHYSKSITQYHYHLMIPYAAEFIGTYLPRVAVSSENQALLYAVVGWSAYYYTIKNSPNGRLAEFLQYYNKSVTLLRKAFEMRKKPDIPMLLTVLQLACIEEHLGDMVNFAGHQKAAFHLIQQLFTPQTIAESPVARTILSWYGRIDAFVGLISGTEGCLSREWYSSVSDYMQRLVAESPDAVEYKSDMFVAKLRVICHDMTILISRRGQSQLSDDKFAAEQDAMYQRFIDIREELNPEGLDPIYRVREEELGPPQHDDDENLVQPDTSRLFRQPVFYITANLHEWQSALIMLKHIDRLTMGLPPRAEVVKLAKEQITTFEAMVRWPSAPNGAVIQFCQAFGYASLVVMTTAPELKLYFRRKYVSTEMEGHIFPPRMREQISEIWSDPSIVDWWLPDGEHRTHIINEIREFGNARNAQPQTEQMENIKDMVTIFSKMELDVSPSKANDTE